jgi:ATP-dependent Clp protease, protease subunit
MIVNRRSPLNRTTNKPNRVENKASEATLYLYDEIGGWFGIDAQEFVKELQNVDADTIHLRINSPGGDVFAARSIQTALKQHKAKVVAHIDGLAASAASFIAMGADEIEMTDGGFLMIHSALSFFDILGYFNAADLDGLMADMAKERDLLARVDDSIANDYAKKCGKTPEECKAWMVAETWFSGAEALTNGLIDRVYDATPVENKFDLSSFVNVPEKLRLSDNGTPSKRKLEKALRDVGLSQTQAKAILADGLKDETQRDVAPSPPEPSPTLQRDAAVKVEPVAKAKDRTSLLLEKKRKIELIQGGKE